MIKQHIWNIQTAPPAGIHRSILHCFEITGELGKLVCENGGIDVL